MKEKKLIASVILGVALVSLITALVAALANSLTLFIDLDEVQGTSVHDDYQYVVGGLTLVAVALGIAFVAVFFANKKNRFAVNLGLAIALVAYCVVSLIVLRVLVPSREGYISLFDGAYVEAELYATDYALFTAYLTEAITLAVSAALTLAAWLYLTLVKKKEEHETDANKE